MLATVEASDSWIARNPADPARGVMTVVTLDRQMTVIEAVPCWLDHTGRPCVPDGDEPILELVTELVGGGPWARTHLHGWSTPALLVGRTIPHVAVATDWSPAARTAGWEAASDGRKRTPVEISRTPMWLVDVADGDPALDIVAGLAFGSDLRHDSELAPADSARLIVPSAAPRWN